MANKEQIIQLPAGFSQFHRQVAGHTFEATNAAAIGLLKDDTAGCVLKPLGKPDCGVRELQFYESLQAAAASRDNDRNQGDSERSLLAELAEHVPRYYDKLKLVVNQREHTFVKLEDLTRGMSKPCVMDVKIGRRTWDPQSSPHKRAVEEQKYVMCKQKLGLCLPGFQVYLPATATTTTTSKESNSQTVLMRHGKDYGKSLNVAGFSQTMALFFNTNTSDSKANCAGTEILLREVLRQLHGIQAWFKRQRLLHFYASSLLICYDFEQLQRVSKSTSSQHLHNGHLRGGSEEGFSQADPSDWVRVRMIDFAHVYPAENGELDQNYTHGLESLIDVVQSILYR